MSGNGWGIATTSLRLGSMASRLASMASRTASMVAVLVVLIAGGCTVRQNRTRPTQLGDSGRPNVFECLELTDRGCIGNTHYTCRPEVEFLVPVPEECPEACSDTLGCVICIPKSARCRADETGREVEYVDICRDDGNGWDIFDECELPKGEACGGAFCAPLCEIARADRSYVGCEFYAADLDNAGLSGGSDASAQQYAIVVSNAGRYPAQVAVEIDTGPYGGMTTPLQVASASVLPGDVEVFRLPRREVDNSSSYIPCDSDIDCVSASQACWCRGGAGPSPASRDCRCRNAPGASGLDDGTHSALTAHAYRITSSLPIVAYQFNPLDNVDVFSNDASLLLPTSGLGTRYTVIGWPQTIADSDNPDENFDPTTTDEDLRATLTIIGTRPSTHVTVTLGERTRSVVGFQRGEFHQPGEVLEFDLGEFDVINLETQAFNGDFSGTIVDANQAVVVFSGSEASDAPIFTTIANRLCCADHVEAQLYGDNTLGRTYFVARTPARTKALNRSFVDPDVDSVAEINEVEWMRLMAVDPTGTTEIRTSLPAPNDVVRLEAGELITIGLEQDVRLDSNRPLSVIQVLSSQAGVGIPRGYPGGDPAMIAVAPIEQYRQDYVFITPELYAFDFVTITAQNQTRVLLDEKPIEEADCEIGPADGIPRTTRDPEADWLVYRCQLSFPSVIGPPASIVLEGQQHDGYHSIRATSPVQVVVSGFDSFVSYAYTAGADLEPLN